MENRIKSDPVLRWFIKTSVSNSKEGVPKAT